LTRLSKPAINGRFQLIGFNVVSMTTARASSLINAIPSLRGDSRGMRRWTIRDRSSHPELLRTPISMHPWLSFPFPGFPGLTNPLAIPPFRTKASAKMAASPSLPQEKPPDDDWTIEAQEIE
jgi:hypothetical protein